MPLRDSGKTKLSKGILEMKFMKKSKDKAMTEIRDEEGRSLFESQVTEGMKAGISNFILEPSYAPIENLIDGRLSFRGMNPEIERLMELEMLAKQPPVNPAMDTDVSDSAMARFKDSLVETVASKFKNKKLKLGEKNKKVKLENESLEIPLEKPTRKKLKFMKPSDD